MISLGGQYRLRYVANIIKNCKTMFLIVIIQVKIRRSSDQLLSNYSRCSSVFHVSSSSRQWRLVLGWVTTKKDHLRLRIAYTSYTYGALSSSPITITITRSSPLFLTARPLGTLLNSLIATNIYRLFSTQHLSLGQHGDK